MKRRRDTDNESEESEEDGETQFSTQVGTQQETQSDRRGGDDVDEDYDGYNRDSELQDAVGKVIRLVLGREAKGQLIRREHITGVLSRRRISFEVILKETRHQLEEVYGMKLVETPVLGEMSKKKTKTKPKAQYVVVNGLAAGSRRVLGEIWTQASEYEVDNGKKFTDSGYFLPKFRHTDTPGTNHELVKLGVVALVVSLVVLAENHLSEAELFRSLAGFGLSDKLESRNSNYHLNLGELMAELAKKDYVNREITEQVTAYSLGRRALVEFNPHSVFEFVRGIYGDHFDSTTKQQTIVTIERVYGAAVAEDLARNDLPETETEPSPGVSTEIASSHHQ
ncbi:MAGE-domain-containing protein [Suhomyces tanzawaensis NRRL Y-17324]|uniref:MAGE-domain-containing protein n=1 Tax=Suhomyces tanzawaensis NRRL Y-17324 TaxID=984487 RepID=A0A1E4SM77_9ASCO|nr:MAGE-domain-containing protein [Suhomyces tanzawaensis NRRL Y-17324]ODV80634.1 MAGE-domain-containing protein [Suhomyces tanzawaensis NRRL Y-17324]